MPTVAQAGPGPALSRVLQPGPAQFVRARLSGPAGHTVVLRAGGRTSAPIQVDGSWQNAGLLVPASTTPTVLTVAPAVDGLRLDVTVSAAAANPTTSTVTPDTRVVNVNGTAFTGKGFLYWPAQIGEQWPANTWAVPATCQQDARLLGSAGVTLLRVPFEDHEPAVHDQYLACLDAFAANGISVLWLLGPPTQFETVQDNPDYVDLYASKNATAVQDVGDHPATAFYTIGNEIERSNSGQLWLGDKATNHPAMLETLIQRMKAADGGRHLIGSTICCPIPGWLANANVPSLDFWGLNAYGQPKNPGTWFTDISNADPRPKIITETGVDRYHCFPGLVQSSGIVATCKTSYKNPGAHSGENQTEQRDWDLAVWDNIAANLSSPTNTGGAVFGVTFFMWSDLWWFSLGFLLPSSTVVREVVGATPWSAPDGIINIEWHGVSNAQPPGATEPRVTSLAFDGLASRWSATAPPAMSGVTTSYTPTTVTISWTTSEPTTTEVQAGANLEENRDGGDMRSDSTTFRRVYYDATLTTTHTATFAALTADPGLCQKVVPRSFTAAGQSVTYPPLIVGCPSTGRAGGV
ncbi:MAG TPA: hypothetical protein VFA94_11755 [Acidimicrobiales bacterium]|nr:hypothetical protein [Acidimicrobiales bacterium]